jgi:hypothetical protein
MKKAIDKMCALAQARTYENHIVRTLEGKKNKEETKVSIEKYMKRYSGVDPQLIHATIREKLKQITGRF